MTNSDYTLSRPVAVSIPAEEIDTLLRERDGRCALVYLALQRADGQPLRPGALGLTAMELRETMETLARLGLVAEKKTEMPLPPADELPQYPAEDLVRRVREDVPFQCVCAHAEQFFGRKLTTPETNTLLGIRDYLGLPTDILMELITHVFTKFRADKGPGRNPTIRMVEKEAYVWARNELLTSELVQEFLEKQQRLEQRTACLLEALDIRGREPSPSEKKYLAGWVEMGFGPEAVREAYDRTVISAGGLKWAYLNKILVNWDQKGLHTLSEILEGDPRGSKRAEKAPTGADSAPRNDLARAKEMLRRRKEGKE